MCHGLELEGRGDVLRLFGPAPFYACMPWHARGWTNEPEYGGLCIYCERDIAVPESGRGKHHSCIYCAMKNGMIPEVEVEGAPGLMPPMRCR